MDIFLPYDYIDRNENTFTESTIAYITPVGENKMLYKDISSNNMASKTYVRKSKKASKRKAKNKNKRQDQRIKKLEEFIYPNIEYKSMDVLANDAAISSSGYANQPMMQIAQGTANNERIGDSVSLVHHGITMTLRRQDSSNVVRILWVYTPSTTALGIDDVLEYGNYTTHTNNVFSSPYKRKSATAENTYKVLFDKVYKFGQDDDVICDKYNLVPWKKPRKLSFNSTGQVMPENYQLQILAISDSTASGHPTISYVCRTKFYDL